MAELIIAATIVLVGVFQLGRIVGWNEQANYDRRLCEYRHRRDQWMTSYANGHASFQDQPEMPRP